MKRYLSMAMYCGVICLLLLNAGCPEGCHIIKYSAVGTWSLTKVQDDNTDIMVLEFIGSRGGGDISWEGYYAGFYEYADSTLRFSILLPGDIGLPFIPNLEVYTGGFEDKDHLAGTYTEYIDNLPVPGTWTAARID